MSRVCTGLSDTDWFYCFGVIKVSFTLECFPLYPKAWGAQGGVSVCGGINIGRQGGENDDAGLGGSYFGKLVEETNDTFSALEEFG